MHHETLPTKNFAHDQPQRPFTHRYQRPVGAGKTDLARCVGADLDEMERDAGRMRGDRATYFAAMKHRAGIDAIAGAVRSLREI